MLSSMMKTDKIRRLGKREDVNSGFLFLFVFSLVFAMLDWNSECFNSEKYEGSIDEHIDGNACKYKYNDDRDDNNRYNDDRYDDYRNYKVDCNDRGCKDVDYKEVGDFREVVSGINITIVRPRFSLPAILSWNDTLEIVVKVNFTNVNFEEQNLGDIENRLKQTKSWSVNLYNAERNVSLAVADVFILNKEGMNVECEVECPVFKTYVGNYELCVCFMGGYGVAERAVAIIEDAKNFTFVQITDTHIQNRTSENENRLVNLSNELNLIAPTFGILTGDTCDNLLYVSDEEIEKAYMRLKNVLLGFNFPIYVVSGNHDNFHGALSIYKEVINPIPDYSFNVGCVHFVGLDSGGPTGPYGDTIIGLEGKGLTDEQISWLSADLDMNMNASEKIIFMHHPAIADDPSVSTGYQEQTISQNREEFIQLCVEKKVSLVLSGHTHEDNSYTADEVKEIGNASFSYPLFIQTKSACAANSEDGNGYRLIEIRNGKIVSYSYDGNDDGVRDASSSYPAGGIFSNFSNGSSNDGEIPCYGLVYVNSTLNVCINCSYRFYLSSDYTYNLSRGWIYAISKLDGIQGEYVHVKFGVNRKEALNVTISAHVQGGSSQERLPDVTIYDYDVSILSTSRETNGILVSGERATLHAMVHSINYNSVGSSRIRVEVQILSKSSRHVEYNDNGLENISFQAYSMVYNFSGAQYVTLEFIVPHVGAVNIEVFLLDMNETCKANNRVHKSFVSNLKPRIISSVQNGSVYRTYEGIVFDARSSYDRDFDTLANCIWDFGDGTHEEKFVVTHSYKKKGLYLVWVEISDEYGATANLSFEVVIKNSLPIVVLSIFPKTPFTFENIILSGEGSYDVDENLGNGNYSWHVSFYPSNCSGIGGGNLNYNSSCKIESYYIGKNVSVVFERPGRLEVVLTIRDSDNESSSLARTINVLNRRPECSFYCLREGYSKPETSKPGDCNSIFSFEEIYFVSSAKDIDGRIVSYFWSFGDGCTILGNVSDTDFNEGMNEIKNESMNKNITFEDGRCIAKHRYERPGVYVVELKVCDDFGLDAKYSKEIVVLNRKPHVCMAYERDGEWLDVKEEMMILKDVSKLYLSSEKSYDEDGGIANVKWLGEVNENGVNRRVLESLSGRITLELRYEGMYIVKLEVYDSYGDSNSTILRIRMEKNDAGRDTNGISSCLGGYLGILGTMFILFLIVIMAQHISWMYRYRSKGHRSRRKRNNLDNMRKIKKK